MTVVTPKRNEQFTGGILMKKTVWSGAGLALAMAFGPMSTHAAAPEKPATLKIAIVTFFSSSGAVAGGPTADAAKMTMDEIWSAWPRALRAISRA
jgi:hypothetical protein